MNQHHPDPAAIAAMEHYDRAWQTELAEYRTADGRLDERRHGEYEHAKAAHAWPVLDRLPDWIAALKAASGRAAAPEADSGARP